MTDKFFYYSIWNRDAGDVIKRCSFGDILIPKNHMLRHFCSYCYTICNAGNNNGRICALQMIDLKHTKYLSLMFEKPKGEKDDNN